jgi:hypothetical protein
MTRAGLSLNFKILTTKYFSGAYMFKNFNRMKLLSIGICASFSTLNSMGQWMEAENNPSAPIKFAKDKSASGGQVTWGTRWYRLAQVPVPMNQKKVYVYINAKTMDHKKQFFQLRCGKKSFGKAYLPVSNKWRWTRLGPVTYTGQPVSVSPNGVAGIKSYLDGFIVSEDSKLSTEKLESIKKLPNNGRAAIGKCTKAPVIDGKLDDNCWENQAVTITPFLNVKSNSFAKEQTQAYMVYDDKNIYIALKCYARVLDPMQNRLHEFTDKVKENNSKSIYKDDCVIILFAPDDKNCYELTVNANGAVADALCKAPDYWQSRNTKWNSNATAKGLRGNGYWSVEIALPKAAVIKEPQENLQFMIGRINQAMKEKSAFGKIDTGFHDSASFSSLFLKPNVPAAGIWKLPEFNAGNNLLKIKTGRDEKGILLIEQLLAQKNAPSQLFISKCDLREKGITEAPLKISDGKLKYRVTLRDGASSDILLETPEYTFNPIVLSINTEIKSSEKYQLYVNGKTGNTKLNHGLNILALKAEKGTHGQIKIGSTLIPVDSSWKYSEDAGKDWNCEDFNASNWKQAPVKEGFLQKGGFLRKIIFCGATELWPNWNQYGVNICLGSSQQFFFPPRGLKGVKNAVDFKMNIELPVGFELLGASSYYDLFKTSSSKIGTTTRSGIKYNRYQISLPENKRYSEKLPRSHEYCSFAIRAPRNYGAQAEMYYYVSAEDSYIEEVPQKLKINLLPELAGKQPQKVIFQIWTGWLSRMSNLELQKKIANDCKRAGFNEIQKLQVATPGINNFHLINFKSWNLNLSELIKQHPDMALVDSKGNKSAALACPTALLTTETGREYFEKTVAEWLQKHKVKHVDWDYEHSPFSSEITCYCPRCLKAFGNGPLSPAEIKNNYESKWIDFMTGRMAELAGMICSIIRKTEPETVFSVYSGYQSERTKRIYGVDWSKLNGKIQLAMCGYGRSPQLLEATQKALSKTPMVLGAIARPYSNTNRTYPTACSAAMLMRRLLDSNGGGVLVYYLTCLDGRTFAAMSNVSTLVAEYENFFTKGMRADSTIKCQGEYAVLEWNKQKLLIILNQTSGTYKFTTHLKQQKEVFDFYSGKNIGYVKSISGNIPPGEIKAYILK